MTSTADADLARELLEEAYSILARLWADAAGLDAPGKLELCLARAGKFPPTEQELSVRHQRRTNEDDYSLVYFVCAKESGTIKIGSAIDPAVRLAALQIGSPVKLFLVATMPGGRRLEHALHLRFHDLRKHGEWFCAHPRLIEFIKREATMQPGSPT